MTLSVSVFDAPAMQWLVWNPEFAFGLAFACRMQGAKARTGPSTSPKNHPNTFGRILTAWMTPDFRCAAYAHQLLAFLLNELEWPG
jgi:hypothetical protein